MNYYERHLGDYAKDTAHLSMVEHGAYTLIMDRYYSTEQGIPDDQKYRVARAKLKEEKEAVDVVLSEFFQLEKGVWIKGRIEQEITKAQSKIKAAQENGKRGGRPKSNPTETKIKPSGFSVGSENKTQSKAHHTPYTIHHTPDTNHQTEVIKGSNTHTATFSEHGISARLTSGHVCKRLTQLGISHCNPGHPDLAALLVAGATLAEFEGAAEIAIRKGSGFAYVLGTVKGQREQAAKLVLHQGRMPSETSNDQAREGARERLFGGAENATA